ncbi:hypothetical protein [Saccharibacillus sacchari]|uniref:hypothetical protein n=1 Tax=Saccharibacillus sacchari TaxID=456493 RepID=UPI0004BB72DA|nr:hypothetical protein [Saccharibacillus sacchari]
MINTDKRFLSKERLVTAALILYVFPYAWLLMEMHYRGVLVLGGLLVTAIAVFLAVTIRVYSSIYLLLLGNVISVFISYRFIPNMSGTTAEVLFFEPLSLLQAMFAYTGFLLIVQAVALIIVECVRRRKSQGKKTIHAET